ncbi:MAG: TetR/AcrR family transcriptional regulator [Hyphomicrobiales bacterium]|nr:TetR/AcrR family transcriptional regulator [Hyphomicrobiales bacterium]
MVQKTARDAPKVGSRRRGRPRAFEAETALAQAMDVFWSDGFAATSLDDVSAATGLNRPSLYGAFGDKRALYLKAYGEYRKRVNEQFQPLFVTSEPLRVKLKHILIAALDLYLSGPNGPRGCFTVLSAASEAIADPDLHGLVSEAIDGTDRAFGRLFADARAAGELPQSADPRRLARMATATIHTLSIRARARVPRAQIAPIIDDAVTTICGRESA